MIQLINVSKRYDKTSILNDVSFKIPAGSIVGLVGRNGSGKSTLLRMISGVLESDAGVVACMEENVYDNPDVKRDIFFVSDDFHFFTKATIKEMRQFYTIFYPKFSLETYYNLLETFGFTETDLIQTFSKGMKRQLALILGLATKTAILLLDESFDGLDPIMRFKVRQILADSVSNSETTVILSSHNLEELSDICDSILIIDNGTIRMQFNEDEFRTTYHKYRVAFKEPLDLAVLSGLNILHQTGTQRIFTFIIKGESSQIEDTLNALNPLLLEEDSLSLDEAFIYEMEPTHENSI